MQALELKIPPPVVGILTALAMWNLSTITPLITLPDVVRISLAIVIALIGLSFDIAALVAFRRAQTTVNPLKPQSASALVRTGVYQITRNPMYVGLTFILTAWAVFLSSGWALILIPVFGIYITRFQIIPEERILFSVFGVAYTAYRSKVRRWL